MRACIYSLAAAFFAFCYSSAAADLKIATFNTESDPAFTTWPVNVAKTITKIGNFDILALQEVEDEASLKMFASAAAHSLKGSWRYVISESGTNSDREADRLGIVYSTKLFRQLGTSEIHTIRSLPGDEPFGKPDWSLRGALVLRLQHIQTGHEFQVVTVHLKCCAFPEIRAHQAALLAKELSSASIPTILLGDTNIPIEPGEDGPVNDNVKAFESLTVGSGLAWVKPTNPVKTQCSSAYNSMLDQVYGPKEAIASTTILFPEPSYCEEEEDGFADHRPVLAVFKDFLPERAAAAIPSDEGLPAEAVAESRESKLQSIARPGDAVAE